MTEEPPVPGAISRRERPSSCLARGPPVLLLAVLLVGVAIGALAPYARAATTTGVTAALVNPGQLIRDASSATPVFGFNLTSTNPDDALNFITVQFGGAGFTLGDDRDLRALDVDSSRSGVGLYRDSGLVDDVLDAGDVPVGLDGIAWVGNTVEMDLRGNGEKLPASVTGLYQWFIVIRTSDVRGSLNNGDEIVATLPVGGIEATNLDVGGFVSQPAVPVAAEPLTVRLTRTVDMLRGVDRWIGPASARVNSMAVLGFSIVDGGIPTNRGIRDRIVSLGLTLTETNGAVSSIDFLPLSTDGSTSGIGFYADSGTVDDEWDAGDAAIQLGSIDPVSFVPGGVVITATFAAPGLDVPDGNSGALDFFIVVRTANIQTWDSFFLEISEYDIVVAGVLGSQAGTVDANLATPLPLPSTVVPSSEVRGDATPPRLRNLAWVEASPNLAALGLDLYFNDLMTTTQFADVTGQARDDESGLLEANFSAEPSLASSPGPMALAGAMVWRTWAGAYGFNATSSDASSPVVVTVYDQVGNSITTTSIDSDFRYLFATEPILIVPNPGWIAPGTPPFWIDTSGKLWFSHALMGTSTVTLRVDLISLFGGGLASASASSEPSLAGGPRPGTVTYPAGTDAATLSVEYDINASSTGEASPVRITAVDNSGQSATRDFAYGLDAEGPEITFRAPAGGGSVSGTVLVRATVTDALTEVDAVELAVDPGGGFQAMYFDGTDYFLPLSTALYPDGGHRILVRAVDVVGNERVVGLDVVFENGPGAGMPPVVSISAPAPGEDVSGVVVFRVFASDPSGIRRVTLDVFGRTVPMAYNAATGYYEYAVDSTGIPDGAYTATATVEDNSGQQSTATVAFEVRNTDYLRVLLDLAPLLLLLFLVAAFLLLLYLGRRGTLRKWLRGEEPTRQGEVPPPPPEGPPRKEEL